MVYLYYISCFRYTILVEKPRNVFLNLKKEMHIP